MESLVSLLVIALFILGIAVIIRERRRIHKWLNKPGEYYEDSVEYKKIKLRRQIEDDTAEIAFIEKQEAEKEADKPED